MAKAVEEEKETGRLEAFSDCVFAFALTLLVLDLKDPPSSTSMARGLVEEWPAFFALFTSFAAVLIMWVNHHTMFNLVKRVDPAFMFLNGLVLFFVTLTPFTTSLIALHLMDGSSRWAATLYSGCFLLLALSWNRMWWRASKGNRLLGARVTTDEVSRVNRNYNLGLLLYVGSVALSVVDGRLGVAAILFMAVFWTVFALRSSGGPQGDKKAS